MKKLFLNLFLIIIIFSISEQTSFAIDKNICLEGNSFINRNKIFIVNEKKPFSGKDVCFYESGNIKYEKNYIGGKKHGTETFWNDKIGFRKSILNFSNGIKQGIYQTWNDNGVLTSQVFFKDDLMEGVRLTWHQEYGEKKSEHIYVKDKKNGKFIRWFKNGKVESKGEFLNDLPNKKWFTWYENGKKKAEGEFDQNIPNGTHFGWHKNGSKKMQVKYIEGILNGEYIIWDDKGKILKDLLFEDGKCINCKE